MVINSLNSNELNSKIFYDILDSLLSTLYRLLRCGGLQKYRRGDDGHPHRLYVRHEKTPGDEPGTVEGVFPFSMDSGLLRDLLAHHAGERGRGSMGGVRAADASVLDYLLYMDSESAVHGETEEMDADGNDSDTGIVDILSPIDDREF